MHRVRPFKYKNKCELFDNVLEKEKMDRIMANKRFVLREKVIDIFHEILYIPTTKQCDFIFFMSVFLVQWNVERLEMIVSVLTYIKYIK